MEKTFKVQIDPNQCDIDEFTNYFLQGIALEKMYEYCKGDVKNFNSLIYDQVKNKEYKNDFTIRKFVNELTFLPFDLENTDNDILLFVRKIREKWLKTPIKHNLISHIQEMRMAKYN